MPASPKGNGQIERKNGTPSRFRQDRDARRVSDSSPHRSLTVTDSRGFGPHSAFDSGVCSYYNPFCFLRQGRKVSTFSEQYKKFPLSIPKTGATIASFVTGCEKGQYSIFPHIRERMVGENPRGRSWKAPLSCDPNRTSVLSRRHRVSPVTGRSAEPFCRPRAGIS